MCSVILAGLSLRSLADDVGDSPASAELLSTGSVTRIIERYADKDVFQFTVLPYVTNRVTVTTGTVWDCEVELLTPSGMGLVTFTNTAASAPYTLQIHSTGSAYRSFVTIKSLAEFSTGSYQVALGYVFTDSDGDGLPDAWELAKFGSITNAMEDGDADLDGFADRGEWLAGTDPNSAASALRIQKIQPVTNWTAVTWTSVPDGLYRLSRASSPTGGWNAVPDLTLAESNTATRSVSGAVTAEFFRVEFVY